MKRFWATVLAGCLTLQSLSGYGLTVSAADAETALMEDSIGEVAVSSEEAGDAGLDSAVPEISQPEEGTLPPLEVTEPSLDEGSAGIAGTESVPQEGSTENSPIEIGGQEAGSEDGSLDVSDSDWAESDEFLMDDLLPDDEFALEDIEIIDDVVETGGETEPESGWEIESESELEPESESESEPESETEFDPAGGIAPISIGEWDGSYIEVKVISTTPAHNPGAVTVSLEGTSHETNEHNESHAAPRTMQIPAEDGTPSGTAKIEVLPGEYNVRVSADEFADFTQTVQVGEHQTVKLEVCTDNEDKRGWMRLGDVDRDHEVTEQDISMILAAVHADSNDMSLNLNDCIDNVVDLADLQIAVQSLSASEEQIRSTVETQSVPSKVERDENTNIVGAENLLFDSGSAQLSPANDAMISEENPVAMSFEFGSGEEAGAELDGMTIKAPVEENRDTGAVTSDISGGYVDVEGTAPDGEPVLYRIRLLPGAEESAGSGTEQPAAISEEQPVQAEEVQNVEEADDGLLPVLFMTMGLPIESIEVVDESDLDEAVLASDEETAENGVVIADGAAEQAPVEETAEPQMIGTATLERDGSFVLNFGSKIAVKKVTIKITGTKKDQKMAEIAKVEFVNGMENRIPAPVLSIPSGIQIEPSNEQLTVTWKAEPNVTGYELEVQGSVKKTDVPQTQIVRVSEPAHKITSINDYSLKNFETYDIRIRSVNGEWNSPWSGVVQGMPKPTSKPEKVDNVTATGGFRSIRVTWKDMDDADGYMVYYAPAPKADSAEDPVFTPVVAGYEQPENGEGRLEKNDYTITGLEDGTEYFVYVVGWNDLGWGVPSIYAVVKTESGEIPQLPKYRLINTSNGAGNLTANIVQAVCGTNLGQRMVESALDTAKGDEKRIVSGSERPHTQWALGVVDDSYASYWLKENEWDDGVAYPVNDFSKGVTVTFNQEYEMNYLTFTAADIKGNPERARVMYWNSETGDEGAVVGTSFYTRFDATNRPYYLVKFHEKVKADQIQLCIGTGYSRIEMKIAEMHFHSYDSLDDDVKALFGDEMYTTLRQDPPVTEEEIKTLEDRVNAVDTESGEYHPLREFLLLDLQAARELLTLQADETVAVNSQITAARDGHINFGGLNEWQPLGRVAAAGDDIIVYVGHNTKNIGESTNLKLVFTQYHAQSDRMSEVYSLKVGRNPITLKGPSGDNFERGGQLYIAYSGNNTADKYGVRVSGGVKIPALNIYGLTGSAKTDAIRTYVAELENYVAEIQSKHVELHDNGTNNNVKYEYGDGRNCILDATDMMMEHMMYSVPASQVWNGLAAASDKAAYLENALDAMEKTMTLFYQHKGLMKGAGGYKETPARHLNIRYMRMFAGAFMYASGNHIGIEWPETAMASGAASWNSFGWGIGHEIGHDINDPKYAIAEITNNYFAQLLTGDYNGLRFKFEDVYEKVTSGTIGRSPNGAVQLALYWQLHLAFDNYTTEDGGDRYLFTDYQTMFDNLFFARVDTYSRNPGLAKKKNAEGTEIELKLDAGVDQNLMRLACAAANANILSFFERWGMVPNEDTINYANACGEATSKALYYVNEDARDYRSANQGKDTGVFDVNVTAAASADANRVTLTLSSDADPELLLGYEIIRSIYVDGRKTPEGGQVVGFQTADAEGNAAYVDVISSMDNRVVSYEVRAVDKFLNYSTKNFSAGSSKITTGGVLGKKSWTIETTIEATDADEVVSGHDDPDSGFDPKGGQKRLEQSANRIIDDKTEDETVQEDDTTKEVKHVFRGNGAGNDRIIIDMQKATEVTSVRYMGTPLDAVSISVSADGDTWVSVKENYTGLAGSKCAEEFATIWFDAVQADQKDKWIGTYDARYVRFTIPQSGQIEINEIDICGPSGDNIEFYDMEKDGLPSYGVTTNEYVYDKTNNHSIPAGSLVFSGRYKGNPAYNVVMLYDQDGRVIGVHTVDGEEVVDAEQVILADVPARGDLGETSDGAWIYYVNPDYVQEALKGVTQVRAELLRVDDALTLVGERVVSDTEFLTIDAENLPEITLTDSVQNPPAEE